MSEKGPTVFLRDILDCINKIAKFTENMSYQEFCANEMAKDAVLRNIEIVGEASAHVPEAVKAKYPSIPWDKMKSIRNIIAHEYFGVDFDIIWKTIKGSLPELKEKIENAIEQEK
jgi:uncharacterized protein with HEPN domain